MAGIAVTQRRPLASMRTNTSSPWRHVDWVLLACVAAIATLGVVMVFSATRGSEPPYDLSYLKKQIMFMILGGVAMAATAWVDYRRIRDYALFIYGGTVFLLAAVLVPGVGSRQNGTQGWFQVGPFQLQPSEFAKLGLIVGFAYVASQFHHEIDNRRFVSLLALAGVPMLFVMAQPDLGTTLVSMAITVVMLAVAGAKGRQLGLLALVGMLLVVVVLQSGMLGDYQKRRLTSFISQDKAEQVALKNATDADYNLRQSKITIGSGGLWGKGLFNGPQTRLKSVPYQHTDFIFTAVGEQLGLVGGAALLALFSVVVWRVWRAAQLARDDFGSLVCAGVLAMFVFQIFENVGMTMGIMPITGIPLPFMSYGGSSTIVECIAIGLVLNVHMRRFS